MFGERLISNGWNFQGYSPKYLIECCGVMVKDCGIVSRCSGKYIFLFRICLQIRALRFNFVHWILVCIYLTISAYYVEYYYLQNFPHCLPRHTACSIVASTSQWSQCTQMYRRNDYNINVRRAYTVIRCSRINWFQNKRNNTTKKKVMQSTKIYLELTLPSSPRPLRATS